MQTNSFMCLSPLAKPTFHWRYVVNHHLCRNLIQTLRSLYCDLVYFRFLKSHPFQRWLPGLPSPGRGREVSWQGKDPCVHTEREPEGPPKPQHAGVTATGNTGERQQSAGHRWPCELDRSPRAIAWEPRGWEGAGLTAPGPAWGAGTEGQEGFGYRPWPSWNMCCYTMSLGFQELM